jgi:hypothetical protein
MNIKNKALTSLALIKSSFWQIVVITIFVTTLIANAFFITRGLNNTIYDNYDFRQAQTAITIDYFISDGITINYITPVLGEPWSIPMEFPLYQYVTASFSKITNFSIDTSGRIISIVFFYIALLYCYLIVKTIIKDKILALLPISLLLLNPVYLFWSRTIMIESTALALSLSYLYYVMLFMETKKRWAIVILIGGLAFMVKITTALLFMPLIAMVIIFKWYHNSSRFKFKALSKYFLWGVLTCLIPLILGLLWSNYADGIRSENPIANSFLTIKKLENWNFGTMQQKFDINVWSLIFKRILDVKIIVINIFFLALVLMKKPKSIWLYLILIFSFLLGPLIFTNLYFVHRYYIYASYLFLIGSFAFVAIHLFQLNKWYYSSLAIVFMVLNLMYQYKTYQYRYYYDQITNNFPTKGIVEKVRNNISENGKFIIIGNDWNSDISYYSHRKSVSILNYMEDVNNELTLLTLEKNQNIEGIVIKGDSLTAFEKDIVQKFEFEQKFDDGNYRFYQ